jgi:hypothetical protein
VASTSSRRDRLAFQVFGSIAIAAFTVVLWYVWLGWDTKYDFDPVTQIESGPYEAWQGIGCGLSLLVLMVVGVLTGLKPWLASVALTVAFTAAWSVQAATYFYQEGLYPVGALYVFCCLTISSLMVSYLTAIISRRLTRRKPPSG